MYFDQSDVPDGYHIGLVYPDKISGGYQVEHTAHILADKNTFAPEVI